MRQQEVEKEFFNQIIQRLKLITSSAQVKVKL